MKNSDHFFQEIIPSQLLMSVTDLLHLDLSNNSLEQLPPQLRRLTNLQTLVLSNNPLSHFQVQLCSEIYGLIAVANTDSQITKKLKAVHN